MVSLCQESGCNFAGCPADRIQFLTCVGLLVACFFQAGRKISFGFLELLWKGLPGEVRPTQDNLSFDNLKVNWIGTLIISAKLPSLKFRHSLMSYRPHLGEGDLRGCVPGSRNLGVILEFGLPRWLRDSEWPVLVCSLHVADCNFGRGRGARARTKDTILGDLWLVALIHERTEITTKYDLRIKAPIVGRCSGSTLVRGWWIKGSSFSAFGILWHTELSIETGFENRLFLFTCSR